MTTRFLSAITHRLALLLVMFAMLTVGYPDAYAASKKVSFTKRYHNEKAINVINDFCKKTGYTLKIEDDFDRNKPITYDFKQASTSTVMKRVLDKEYQGKVKKGVLTITRKPTPPETFTVMATEPTEVIDNDSLTTKTYYDTLFSVNCRTRTIEKVAEVQPAEPAADTKPTRQDTTGTNRLEHNLQVLVGAGYSSMGYTIGSDGREIGFVGANVQVRYLYYFAPNWGIGLGVGFANYGSTGTLNTVTTFSPNVSDSDIPGIGEGEAYEHRVRSHDWQEFQSAYMVEVPIMVQCTYPIKSVTMKNGPLKIYADLGVNLGLTINSTRQLKGGSIEHVGWYKPWKLELEQITGHDFFSEQAEAFGTDKQKINIKLPAIGLMADFGFAIPLRTNLDLLLGLYATYTVNNVAADRQDIGWRHEPVGGVPSYRDHAFMNNYNGLIGTQYAEAIHPWQAGITIGINFNGRTAKRVKKSPEPAPEYERIQVCDTTKTVQPRVETVRKVVAIQQIKRTLEKSVIWFDLNSTEPKLEPADILVQVAEVLKDNPTERILITGHASREGKTEKNQRLSEQRAQIIVKMLLDLGVKAEQMVSRGEGVGRDYVAGEHDIRLDRRVEITVIE